MILSSLTQEGLILKDMGPVTYADEKRYDKAAEAYQKAIHEKESGSQHRIFITWMDLGETYYQMGRYKEAYEVAQRAEALLVIVFEKARQYYIRRSIKNAILSIELESDV